MTPLGGAFFEGGDEELFSKNEIGVKTSNILTAKHEEQRKKKKKKKTKKKSKDVEKKSESKKTKSFAQQESEIGEECNQDNDYDGKKERKGRDRIRSSPRTENRHRKPISRRISAKKSNSKLVTKTNSSKNLDAQEKNLPWDAIPPSYSNEIFKKPDSCSAHKSNSLSRSFWNLKDCPDQPLIRPRRVNSSIPIINVVSQNVDRSQVDATLTGMKNKASVADTTENLTISTVSSTDTTFTSKALPKQNVHPQEGTSISKPRLSRSSCVQDCFENGSTSISKQRKGEGSSRSRSVVSKPPSKKSNIETKSAYQILELTFGKEDPKPKESNKDGSKSSSRKVPGRSSSRTDRKESINIKRDRRRSMSRSHSKTSVVSKPESPQSDITEMTVSTQSSITAANEEDMTASVSTTMPSPSAAPPVPIRRRMKKGESVSLLLKSPDLKRLSPARSRPESSNRLFNQSQSIPRFAIGLDEDDSEAKTPDQDEQPEKNELERLVESWSRSQSKSRREHSIVDTSSSVRTRSVSRHRDSTLSASSKRHITSRSRSREPTTTSRSRNRTIRSRSRDRSSASDRSSSRSRSASRNGEIRSNRTIGSRSSSNRSMQHQIDQQQIVPSTPQRRGTRPDRSSSRDTGRISRSISRTNQRRRSTSRGQGDEDNAQNKSIGAAIVDVGEDGIITLTISDGCKSALLQMPAPIATPEQPKKTGILLPSPKDTPTREKEMNKETRRGRSPGTRKSMSRKTECSTATVAIEPKNADDSVIAETPRLSQKWIAPEIVSPSNLHESMVSFDSMNDWGFEQKRKRKSPRKTPSRMLSTPTLTNEADETLRTNTAPMTRLFRKIRSLQTITTTSPTNTDLLESSKANNDIRAGQKIKFTINKLQGA